MNWTRYLLYFFILLLTSCEQDAPTPNVDELKLVPISFKEAELTKTLVFDNVGRLVQIQYQTALPDGSSMDSFHNFQYDALGRLIESTTDTGWRYLYSYTNNHIVRTDEYLNGVKSDYHLFKYDSKGKLIERITYQNIPAEGGEIPVAKDSYTYDNRGNLTTLQLYYYTSYGLESRLLTELVFSDYDDKINSEEYFDIMGVNPLTKLRKNNPGKLVVKNNKGNISTLETYHYTYHEKGYALTKKVEVVHYNGNTGSYVATYTFRE